MPSVIKSFDFPYSPLYGYTFFSGMKLLLTLSALLVLAWPAFAASPKGTYNGLFQTDTNSQQSSGAITITTTTKGTFTGKLQCNGTQASFRGTFDADGNAEASAKTRGATSLKLLLALDPSSAAAFINGTISDGKWTAQVAAKRAAFDGKTSSAPQAGRYTVILPSDHDSSMPVGTGYATVSVSKAGRVKLAGSLADGTKISQAAALSSDGSWPFYVSLYGGQGSAISWILFLHQPQSDLVGSLSWIKPASSKAKFYPAGFITETSLIGSAYVPPASGAAPIHLTTGNVTFAGGNLDQTIVNNVTIDSKGRVKNLGDNKLTLNFTPSQGAFRGTITPPGASKSIPFAGVVMQSTESGGGYFLGASQSSFVQLTGSTQEVVTLQTLGSSITAEVDLGGIAPKDFVWEWSDGTISSNLLVATKNFGSDGARNQTLNVSPAGLIEGINLGFDGSDGATNAPITYRTSQQVAAVNFVYPLTGLRYWASSYNPITNTLDFTGFLSLEEIECFHCTNLEHVAVANLPSLKRICFESCDLQELDISGDPNLEDVRAAINGPGAFTEIKIGGGSGPKIWHFCIRDNPQITQDFSTIMTNFYSLKEPWFWNANQSGALKFASSNLTDVEVQGNHYDFVDLSGQKNLQFFWGGDNNITNLVITGCVNLLELKAGNNQLPSSVLDSLLAFLDTSCPNLQLVDLHSNAQPPSAAGCSHATNLRNRNVIVYEDCP
jgi:hypothetical protein